MRAAKPELWAMAIASVLLVAHVQGAAAVSMTAPERHAQLQQLMLQRQQQRQQQRQALGTQGAAAASPTSPRRMLLRATAQAAKAAAQAAACRPLSQVVTTKATLAAPAAPGAKQQKQQQALSGTVQIKNTGSAFLSLEFVTVRVCSSTTEHLRVKAKCPEGEDFINLGPLASLTCAWEAPLPAGVAASAFDGLISSATLALTGDSCDTACINPGTGGAGVC